MEGAAMVECQERAPEEPEADSADTAAVKSRQPMSTGSAAAAAAGAAADGKAQLGTNDCGAASACGIVVGDTGTANRVGIGGDDGGPGRPPSALASGLPDAQQITACCGDRPRGHSGSRHASALGAEAAEATPGPAELPPPPDNTLDSAPAPPAGRTPEATPGFPGPIASEGAWEGIGEEAAPAAQPTDALLAQMAPQPADGAPAEAFSAITDTQAPPPAAHGPRDPAPASSSEVRQLPHDAAVGAADEGPPPPSGAPYLQPGAAQRHAGPAEGTAGPPGPAAPEADEPGAEPSVDGGGGGGGLRAEATRIRRPSCSDEAEGDKLGEPGRAEATGHGVVPAAAAAAGSDLEGLFSRPDPDESPDDLNPEEAAAGPGPALEEEDADVGGELGQGGPGGGVPGGRPPSCGAGPAVAAAGFVSASAAARTAPGEVGVPSAAAAEDDGNVEDAGGEEGEMEEEEREPTRLVGSGCAAGWGLQGGDTGAASGSADTVSTMWRASGDSGRGAEPEGAASASAAGGCVAREAGTGGEAELGTGTGGEAWPGEEEEAEGRHEGAGGRAALQGEVQRGEEAAVAAVVASTSAAAVPPPSAPWPLGRAEAPAPAAPSASGTVTASKGLKAAAAAAAAGAAAAAPSGPGRSAIPVPAAAKALASSSPSPAPPFFSKIPVREPTAVALEPAPSATAPQGQHEGSLTKASSGASKQSASGRQAAPLPAATAGFQGPTAAPAAASPDAARPAVVRHAAAAAGGPEASMSDPGTGRAPMQKGARTQHASDPRPQPLPSAHQPHPNPTAAKPRSYSQLHTGRGPDTAASASVTVSSAAATAVSATAAAAASAPATAAAAELSTSEGEGGSQDMDESPPASAAAAGSLKPRQRLPWTDADEEPDLIARVEVEALQLGLNIYPCDHGGGGGSSTDEPRPGAQEGGWDGTDGEGRGEGQEEEAESLEAIMALGRRPSEIAELLLGGVATAPAAATAGGGGGDEEVRRRRKQERRERKRALRREQRRQQRQRRRALMGLDPYGSSSGEEDHRSSTCDESSITTSSSSSPSPAFIELDYSRTSSYKHGSADADRGGGVGGGGGEIRTADSRALLLLSAAGSALSSVGLFDGGSSGGNDEDQPRDLPEEESRGEGRILTSAAAGAALGLLLRSPPSSRAAGPSRDGAGGAAAAMGVAKAAELEPSGFVPSYLLDTLPPPPRASDGMTCQPRCGSDYSPSIAPTMGSLEGSSCSTLPRTADYGGAGRPPPPPRTLPPYGDDVEGRHGSSRGAGAAAPAHGGGMPPPPPPGAARDLDEHEHEQFLAARDERSRNIAEKLAALQEESRRLHQQSWLLQERTREIGRSVGLPRPPRLSGGGAAAVAKLTPPPLPTDAGADVPPLPLLRRRTPSPASAAAAPDAGASFTSMPESRSGNSDVDSSMSSSLLRHPAPISWALPNRSNAPAPGHLSHGTSPPRAFFSPPGPGRRPQQQLPQPAPVRRTGSGSSLTDSLLPRWAEQVESPLTTPAGRQHHPHTAATSAAAAAPSPGAGAANGGGLPLLKHVPKARHGTEAAPAAVGPAAGGRGQRAPGAKSRLGVGAAAAPGVIRGQLQPQLQPQPGLLQPMSGTSGLAELYDLPQQQLQLPPPPQQQFPYLPNPFQPGLPTEWPGPQAAGRLPPPLLPPQLPLPVLADAGGSGSEIPSQFFAPMASVKAPAPVAALSPEQGQAAHWTAANANIAAPTRMAKPPKASAPSGNGGASLKGAASSARGNGSGGGGSHGAGSGGLPTAPPPWMHAAGPGMALPPLGMLPMLLPPPYGGMMESMGPWMALPLGVAPMPPVAAMPPPACAGSPRGAGAGGGNGGGRAGSSSGGGPAATSFKDRSANGRNQHAAAANKYGGGAAKSHGGGGGAASSPKPLAPALPEGRLGYLGPMMPYGLPRAFGIMPPPGLMGANGAGPCIMPLVPQAGDGGGGSNGGSNGGLQQVPDGGDGKAVQPWGHCEGVLPPVKPQAGKGKMSRSAPPGSYSGPPRVGSATAVAAGMYPPGSSGAAEEVVVGCPASMAADTLGIAAWPPPAMGGVPPMYGMAPPLPGQYVFAPAGGSNAEAAAASVIQQQQMERYRELEDNLVNKLDRQRQQQQQGGPGGKGRDRRRNSHDGRPVFRLF